MVASTAIRTAKRSRGLLSERPVDGRCRLPRTSRQDVAVCVGREPDRGVAQQLHDRAQLLALVEEERGERVTQVMQVQPFQPGGLARLFEPPVHVPWLQAGANRVG